MKRIVLSCVAAAALLAVGIADAQNRGGGGGGGAGMSRGGGGGGMGMGMSRGGGGGSMGMSRGGGMGGGDAYRGGQGWNGSRGGYMSGGNGYRGGYAGTAYRGSYRGGDWHGGGRNYWGHHGGHNGWRGAYWGPSVGFYFGAPLYWNYGYAYPGYAVSTYADPAFYSAPVVVEEENNVYVQPPASAPAVNYWYYCTDPAGYYPYVQTCNKAWVPVTPQSVMPQSN